MAEHVLETRIQLRYDTYSNWMNSTTILKVGEAAIASFPQSTVIGNLSNTVADWTPPAIGIKIGDGFHRFSELPWVQAVAADVYNWAKTSTKPSYSASEITGLASFLEENFNLSGDVTIAPRIYQIIEGTGNDAHKYYLRYKENNEESQWIIDTNHPIDLTSYEALKTWIGIVYERYPTLANFTAAQTRTLLSGLSNNDSPTNNQFVTAVSQTDGQISVEKAQPAFSSITGTVSISQGGTGKTSFPNNSVIITENNEFSSIPLTDEMDSSNSLVPTYIIKNYVDRATAGLTGAMHFIGSANVVIRPGSAVNPNINGYDFNKVQAGDVILYEQQEYVWDGSSWTLLGDEGSYAVKGSIKNVDIAEDADIDQSKIANLSETFDTKVDKVEGKTLTTNDFTDALAQKLDGIAEGAQVNTIEHIYLNNVEVRPTTIEAVDKVVNLQIKEFDTASQDKLAAIEAGAQVNKIEKVIFDGEEITPNADKVISITSDPHTDHINKIESIFINGTEFAPNKDKEVRITLDQAALNLNVLEGAIVPTANGLTVEEVSQSNKKLELARIAKTGDVKDLLQTNNEYITFDCGSSTDVI